MLTATQIAHLNGADEAHQQAGVGTLLASLEATVGSSTVVAAGTYTADATDASATTVDIDSGLAAGATAMVQVLRAGVKVIDDAAISVAAGVITFANGSTYSITDGDVVNYIVF